MKRLTLYVTILMLTLMAPVKRLDVAKLRPVEVIHIYKENDRVVIQTDTDDRGEGESAGKALEDMRRSSPAVIYLDTAEFLLIGENADVEAEALRGELKDNVRLCKTVGEIDLSQAARFLTVQGTLPTFWSWNKDTRLPRIYTQMGRIKMLKNSEKTA